MRDRVHKVAVIIAVAIGFALIGFSVGLIIKEQYL